MSKLTPKPISQVQADWMNNAWVIAPDKGTVKSKLTSLEIGWVGEGRYVFLRLVEGWRNVHRSHVIWWKSTGKWPEHMLDHEDRNRGNDKIGNLRYTNSSLNALNTSYVRGKTAYAL